MRTSTPELLKKVVVVSGDIGVDGLGLSTEDENRLIDKVSIVYHSAAALSMESELKKSINMNVIGTQRMLQLAEKMKKLETFVHLSTAYCYCEQAITEEVVIPTSKMFTAHQVINLARIMPADMLEMIKPKLLDQHPNTYTYTKRLSEEIVAEYFPKLPVVIARPSIVTPSYEEPIPGWVDNINGPAGIFLAGAAGVLRCICLDATNLADAVPVDYLCNGLIVLVYYIHAKTLFKNDEIPVLNVTTDNVYRISWAEVMDLTKSFRDIYPLKLKLWYPDASITQCKVKYYLMDIFLHWMPAYFVDFLLIIIRKKPIHTEKLKIQ